MGILADEDRPIGLLSLAVLADGLGDRQDMGFGECGVERRATMAAGPEADKLAGAGHVRLAFIILPFKVGDIDEQFLGCRFPGKGADRHSCFSGLVLPRRAPDGKIRFSKVGTVRIGRYK